MKSLAHRGRHVVITASGDPHVRFDLSDFYHREGRLLGVDTLKLTLAESASVLRQLVPGFESGAFRPPAVETCPLTESAAATFIPTWNVEGSKGPRSKLVWYV